MSTPGPSHRGGERKAALCRPGPSGRSEASEDRVILPVLLALAWIFKMYGLFLIEHDDSNAAGPDYGLIITLLLGTVAVAWQYFRARRLLAAEG